MGREEKCRGRGAILFLHFSFWEPLFSRSIHHNDRNPQTHLFSLFPSPPPLSLFSLPLYSHAHDVLLFKISFLNVEISRASTVNKWIHCPFCLSHRNCLLTNNDSLKRAHFRQGALTHTQHLQCSPSKADSSSHKFSGLPCVVTCN